MALFDTAGIAHVGPPPSDLLVVAIILAGCYGFYCWLLPKPIPGIPYSAAAAQSVLGDVLTLQDDPDRLAWWCGKHVFMGPLAKPMVLAADVGDARDILTGRSDFDRSSYIVNSFPLFRGFHFRMKTGDAWRTLRAWLKDLMAPPFLHGVAVPTIHAAVLDLVRLWELQTRFADGRPFSMKDDLRSLALDVISVLHFGDEFQESVLARHIQHVGQLAPAGVVVGPHGEVAFPRAPVHEFTQGLVEVRDRLAAIFDAVNTKLLPRLVSWWFRCVALRFRRFFAAKDVFIRRHFDVAVQRSRHGEQPRTGIDYMVYREEKAAFKAGRAPLVGKQIMIDEAYSNLIAGQHTTSAALVWLFKSLSSARLPYLDVVVEGTMRLRAAFLLPRDAVHDTTLLSRVIPKGTVVVLVAQGHGFEPDTCVNYRHGGKKAWPRRLPGSVASPLDVFDPERWLREEVVFDGASHPQLAFGFGVRACWGRRLAKLEMRFMLALVVWGFELLPVLPAALAGEEASFDISYRAKKGFVRLRSRGGFNKP
ncbi:cytochrome P450 [Lasiosphaeria ovina]|uniref:Cytochrome P450 n=1 Tax=Lasiosphaeria ovina TaxID=92902 RepID=A0AAE0NNR6_9PEZI|nr:cytochrome P450 [Lasiosphaeria ovina]